MLREAPRWRALRQLAQHAELEAGRAQRFRCSARWREGGRGQSCRKRPGEHTRAGCSLPRRRRPPPLTLQPKPPRVAPATAPGSPCLASRRPWHPPAAAAVAVHHGDGGETAAPAAPAAARVAAFPVTVAEARLQGLALLSWPHSPRRPAPPAASTSRPHLLRIVRTKRTHGFFFLPPPPPEVK